ncbi:MAG: hypothetical protein JNK15_03135 [Planctomycetes bacterium]|nr:hypothetical protein [Planctomycetota bacterium]
MVIARSTRETFRFQLEAERNLPEGERTTFLLAHLPTRIMIELLDLASRGESGKWIMVALKVGLVGWENFNDADGRPEPFVFDRRPCKLHGIDIEKPVSDDSLNALPAAVAAQIAKAVIEGNQITATDAKN